MKHTQSAGGVVLNKAGQVLVVNQHHDSWSLPKGHINDGEDALAAARREIAEESGITDLQLVKSLGSYERHKIPLNKRDAPTELKTIFMYLFRTSQSDLSPTDPANPEAVWVQKEKVAKLLTHPKDKEFFEKVLRIL